MVASRSGAFAEHGCRPNQIAAGRFARFRQQTFDRKPEANTAVPLHSGFCLFAPQI
jgi:hypothetical protein